VFNKKQMSQELKILRDKLQNSFAQIIKRGQITSVDKTIFSLDHRFGQFIDTGCSMLDARCWMLDAGQHQVISLAEDEDI
jgi:hypothetical protein